MPLLTKPLDGGFTNLSQRVSALKQAVGDHRTGERTAEWGAVSVSIGELYAEVEAALADVDVITRAAARCCREPEPREIETAFADQPHVSVQRRMAEAWSLTSDEGSEA